MRQARAHRRLAGTGAFVLLALVAEIVGRSLTVRLDLGKHVPSPSYVGADYYPFLLAGVKVSVALMLAAITWRFLRARSSARAARRVLARVGARPLEAPRIRIELSLRRWAFAFGATAGIYLVQTDTEQLAQGRWPLLSPWLHTSALWVFAVLAVVVAVLHGGVTRWLSEYERYAAQSVAAAWTLVRRLPTVPRRRQAAKAPPRRLFGLSFESRPPPAVA
jgi:hypothetical protein